MTLLRKLVLVNVVAIACVLLIVYMAVEYFAADYFMTLMTMYDISPTSAHELFLEAVYRALAGAALMSLAVVTVIGYFLSARILRPLRQMNAQTQKVADGDYSGEIGITTDDEVGRLARSFNRMCRALERSDTARRRLILDVAHELRTPVTNIRGYLEALRDGVIAPSRPAFESLHEETLRLGAQVEDMLLLSRAEGVSITMQYERFDIATLLRDLMALFAPRFADKRIELNAEGLPAHLELEGDAGRLAQVMRNVVENVWRYTPAGGRCRIAAGLLGEAVEIEICNGPVALPADALPRIFERFYRYEPVGVRLERGAGIGLAITKEVIVAHGGLVRARIDGGALCIQINLPARAADAREAA